MRWALLTTIAQKVVHRHAQLHLAYYQWPKCWISPLIVWGASVPFKNQYRLLGEQWPAQVQRCGLWLVDPPLSPNHLSSQLLSTPNTPIFNWGEGWGLCYRENCAPKFRSEKWSLMQEVIRKEEKFNCIICSNPTEKIYMSPLEDSCYLLSSA